MHQGVPVSWGHLGTCKSWANVCSSTLKDVFTFQMSPWCLNYEAACLLPSNPPAPLRVSLAASSLPSVRGHRRKHLRISGRRKEGEEREDCCKQGSLAPSQDRGAIRRWPYLHTTFGRRLHSHYHSMFAFGSHSFNSRKLLIRKKNPGRAEQLRNSREDCHQTWCAQLSGFV